jgi:ubiquinone/menaquinone biosynthesis C-methylase UbiE
MKNIDKKVVEDFGEEWNKYSQSEIADDDLKKSWSQYFDIFPFDELNSDSEGFDMGCGSGRWGRFVSDKVGILNCIDPSAKALEIAKKNLSSFSNINFYNASVSDKILEENSQDFGYCLGVLHHIPDTQQGIKDCAKLLKKDAPFLLYLYYNFENRSLLFKAIWKASDFVRKICSSMPSKIKIFITTMIAYLIYLPLARIAFFSEKLGLNVNNFPLSDYRKKSFYFMKTDALDRFGTSLEKRFSREEIKNMLLEAGFTNIKFSETMPMWVCLSRKL